MKVFKIIKVYGEDEHLVSKIKESCSPVLKALVYYSSKY